ncbi:hypothetical protein LNP07_03895 [Apilactobacillus sp. M161]|uniref:Uncharacterized protein n=1 Tax=Apilactobacillus xinyiensis TaxID=2841032 RepID=A0ABT0I1R2_9LACO|nr:hypothetical protein [Apilactobacillus xinyiensis]MCK8624651.1 hypothetical protein [Apilactobacillus xinyiensis]
MLISKKGSATFITILFLLLLTWMLYYRLLDCNNETETNKILVDKYNHKTK